MLLSQRIRNKLIFHSTLAMGSCAPNPPVASVLLAEKADQQAGYDLVGGATESPDSLHKRHAEIVCLDQYQDLLEKGRRRPSPLRLYLSLEPCSHHGRTPPCTERILANPSIHRILAWEADPFLAISGIKVIKQNQGRASFLSGRQARTSLGTAFLQGFLSRMSGKGPRFHLKAACTQEGIMGIARQKLVISSPPALAFGHLLRAKLDAVLVAMGTIVNDRPHLHLRSDLLQNLGKLPKPHLPISGPSDLLCQSLLDLSVELASFTCKRNLEFQPQRLFLLGRYDAELGDFFALQQKLAQQTKKAAVFFVEEPYAAQWQKLRPDLDLQAVLPALQDLGFCQALRTTLGQRGYNEVLIEGGAALFSSLQSGLAKEDRIYILRSQSSMKDLLNEGKAIRLPEFMMQAPVLTSYKLSQDTLELKGTGL